MTPLLQLSQIDFHFGDRQVIRDVALSLETGTCIALIGPNGVGKTTLLRIAAGVLAPSAGTVFIEGRPLSAMPLRHRSRAIALVPQQLEVPFDFTVEQIVAQGRTPYLGLLRGATRQDRDAVDHALDLVDITSLRHRIFNELSGGERQRVKIALGLAQQPKLLLLDEPTQNLDIGRQVELIELLHNLRAQGITMFASMHDLHLVPKNFSTVHLLYADRSMLSGTPESVMTSANLAAAFRCQFGGHSIPSRTAPFQESITESL